jgi:hypothetical protein
MTRNPIYTEEERPEAYKVLRRKANKRWYEKVKADPALLEKRNARQREYNRRKREKEGKPPAIPRTSNKEKHLKDKIKLYEEKFGEI